MSERRRTTGAGFWISLALCMLVVYPLSIGPAYPLAVRIASRPGRDLEWPMKLVQTLYAPIERLIVATHTQTRALEYVEWWHGLILPRVAPASAPSRTAASTRVVPSPARP